jgi:hypothetical protein
MNIESKCEEPHLKSLVFLLRHKFKNPWRLEEDSKLRSLVAEIGLRSWCEIAKNIPGRNGKQCRDRWMNHLSPEICKTLWSTEEEWRLFLYYQLFPSKWKKIAGCMTGRSENSVKNKWHCLKKTKIHIYENHLKEILAQSKQVLPRNELIKQTLTQMRSLKNFANSSKVFTPMKNSDMRMFSNDSPSDSSQKVKLFDTTISARKPVSPINSASKDAFNSRVCQKWQIQLEGSINHIYITPIKSQFLNFRESSDKKSNYSLNFNSFK